MKYNIFKGSSVMSNLALEKLLKQQSMLDARIKAIKAREAYQERKNETRRKILAGAYILEQHTKDGTMHQLTKELDWYLTRKNDRALFGLYVKDEPEKSK